jgi:hypothetical protein
MTAINRLRCSATGSTAVGVVRELTNSIAIEGPQSIVDMIRAPPKTQKAIIMVHSKSVFWHFVNPGNTHLRHKIARPSRLKSTTRG